jgi:peroxiredoxin
MGGKLAPGDKAPNFKLPDDSGGIKSLKSFAGQSLVLYFYPKDDTTGCTKEAIDFNGLKGAFAPRARPLSAFRLIRPPVTRSSRPSTSLISN